MSSDLYLVSDRALLESMAAFQAGFQPPSVILDGLTEDQATAKPHGLEHSIADIVGHMLYWQEFFNKAATSGFSDFPEHAAIGWPAMEAGGWNDLRARFLASVEATQRHARECTTLDQKLFPEGFPLEFFARESIGSGLLHAAVHSSHHLGQIVTLRQLLGAWPPPAGSMTW